MNQKKIVFFDIDGTIYVYGKPVPEDTVQAIRALRENGHYAVICTGRTKSMIYPMIFDIGFDGMIAGAGTYVEFEGEILKQYQLPTKVSSKIIADMREHGIFAIPEGIRYVYFDQRHIPASYRYIYDTYLENVGENVRDLTTDTEVEISKISGRILDKARGKEFVSQYEKDFRIVYHSEIFIEMIPKPFSKAVGIEQLIQKLGISRKNTYAFGDGMNDYEMLKYVKYGVAMGNAADEFKAMADYVTGAYDQGGIRQALQRFGLIG